MPTIQIITTPLPFPTMPIYVPPKSQRSGVQQHWYIILIVLHLVFFALFVGLLVYYIWFVKTPGKWLTEEKIRDDGLSEWDASSSSSSSDDSFSDASDSSDSDLSNEENGENGENGEPDGSQESTEPTSEEESNSDFAPSDGGNRPRKYPHRR